MAEHPHDETPDDASHRRAFPRRHFLLGAVGMAGAVVGSTNLGSGLASAATLATGATGTVGASTTPTLGVSMYIVAHQDDSLLFQSPALLQDIQSGRANRTVYLTAGDNGLPQSYWGQRELGVQAAYAQMAGVANSWTSAIITANGHSLQMMTLTAAPTVSVIFMRLPDGGYPAGTGTSLYGFQSLMQLWQGTITSITTVDKSATYTSKSNLISTLAALMTGFQPQRILVQDFVNTYGDGDHMDHYASADFAESAHALYASPHQFTGYEGYSDQNLAANVTGALLSSKQSAFYAYGAFDNATCSSASSCSTTQYAPWLLRQYAVGSQSIGVVAFAGSVQSVAPGAAVQLDGSGSTAQSGKTLTYQWAQIAGTAVTLSSATSSKPTFVAPSGHTTLTFSLLVSDGTTTSAADEVSVNVVVGSSSDTNVALLATATASSQNTSTGQLASAAIDGVISGYPNTTTAEWATVNGGIGSWIQLNWTQSYTLDHVVLYDRPNANDQITAGTLTFSDGSTVTFGSLPNDATSGLTVTFPAKATTSLKMTVTTVSATTLNVGLAEFQAWGIPTTGSTTDTPVASAGAAQSISSGGSVILDGSGSTDPLGAALTYAWTQTVGAAVTLSSLTAQTPSFTAPTGPATLTFSLVVSNGTTQSAPSTVTITVAAPSGSDTNVALLATATASSQNTSTGQTAAKAIDGVISGYPNTTTAEWATVNGGTASWLLLTWTKSYTLDHVVLYDRPNTNDQITGGTLTFSDGSTVTFGSLPNDAATSGLTVTFPAKATTSLKMTVTTVSSTTQNVGLSEIQAWGIVTGTTTGPDTPVASAGTAQSAASAAAVTLDGSGSTDPLGAALTYAWTQTVGAAVTLSSASAKQPTFTAPTGPATLTFSLVVSNGTTKSSPSTVTITVAAATAPTDTNVALLATATASSQNTSTGQTATKAVDGVISGYPNTTTAEWATINGGAASWLLLTWTKSYTLDHVVLYDRPNTNDQITGGTLTFSDGTSVTFGALPNDASTGLTVTFPAKATTSVKMTVTMVSSTTLNVGLAEIQAWGIPT